LVLVCCFLFGFKICLASTRIAVRKIGRATQQILEKKLYDLSPPLCR